MNDTKQKPSSLADILRREMTHLARGKMGDTLQIQERWEDVVGPLIAKRSRVLFIKGPCLTVGVNNAAWMQELTLQKKRILQKLQELFPELGVQDIRLKLD